MKVVLKVKNIFLTDENPSVMMTMDVFITQT